jgi:hypothetical protein
MQEVQADTVVTGTGYGMTGWTARAAAWFFRVTETLGLGEALRLAFEAGDDVEIERIRRVWAYAFRFADWMSGRGPPPPPPL